MKKQADLQEVKNGLLRYSKADKFQRNTAFNFGFNDGAQSVIDWVAESEKGFASEIAKTVKKYNYSISEKQAYWIAKAAIENNCTFLYDRDDELKIIFGGK